MSDTDERPPVYDRLKSRKKPIYGHVDIVNDGDVAEAFTEAATAQTDAQSALESAQLELDRTNAAYLADPTEYNRASFDLATDTLAAAKTELERANAAYIEAETARTADTVRYRFRSIGRKAYDDLIDAHPPTDEAVAKARKEWETNRPVAQNGQPLPFDPPTFNGDSFPQALIAASLVQADEPGPMPKPPPTEPILTLDQVIDMFADPNWASNELFVLWTTAHAVNNSGRVVNLGKG